MTYTDILTGTITGDVNVSISTNEGNIEGDKRAVHSIVKRLTDGTSSNQATGFFSSSFTATTGGITVSLADSVDPLGAAGDDTPTIDPEGLKLRALLIENQDTTNFISVKRGTNGETSMLSGGTDSIKITAGGMLLWVSPAGVSAMNDGSDDELLITANSASCTVKITYVFG
jgi:hypothetical protein